MIGARDLAFPRLNLLSWYLFMLGGCVALFALILRRRRHRLDVLHAALDASTPTATSMLAALGIFIVRLLLDR